MNDAKQFDKLTVTLKFDLNNGDVTVEEFSLIQTHLTDLLEVMLQEADEE